MIISASRRTDIPAHFSPWLFQRLREGFVLVRNPMNFHQVSRVSLSPEVVDGLVLWTKNPTPMLDRLDLLEPHMYYVQFTLTAYGPDVEPHIPRKGAVLAPAFQRLSDRIGPDRVLWRYDPIFLSRTYTFAYHLRAFESLAKRLRGYTKVCTISFLDFYRGTAEHMAGLGLTEWGADRQTQLAGAMAEIARSYGIELRACAEALDLKPFGIRPAACIDGALFSRLLGCPLRADKDRGQRVACRCMESIDIGAYQTCPGGCRYCYATFSPSAPRLAAARHDPGSPLLLGALGPGDRITERNMRSCREEQLRLDEYLV